MNEGRFQCYHCKGTVNQIPEPCPNCGAIDWVPTELNQIYNAIRAHRDARGDDRCWQDDEELYKILPEGYTPPARDTAVELQQCEKYIACRHNPATEYISPQRRIEELEREVMRLEKSWDELNEIYKREVRRST